MSFRGYSRLLFRRFRTCGSSAKLAPPISRLAAEVRGCKQIVKQNYYQTAAVVSYRSLEIAPSSCTDQGWHDPCHITEIEAKSAGYAETILKPHWTEGKVVESVELSSCDQAIGRWGFGSAHSRLWQR
jgi:hypothetical protein